VNGPTVKDACMNILKAALKAPEGETAEEKTRRLTAQGKAAMARYSKMLDEVSKDLSHEEIEQHELKDLLKKDHTGRRLTANDALANDAYDSCTWSTGNACVLKEGCKFAFRGSDDFQDWVSNAAGVFYSTWIGGVRLHAGFAFEFYKLRSKMQSSVNGCSNPTWIGHSLGGAIATVASNYYGKGSVHTFGMPQTYDDNKGCRKSGTRMFHEYDPVAGNLYGAMSSYWHAQAGTEIYYHSCKKRNWWGSCKSKKYRTRGTSCTKHSGTWDVNFGAHSMDNYEKYY